METIATPRPVLRLNRRFTSLSLGPTLFTRRGQQPLLFRCPKGCVVGEISDFKDVVITYSAMAIALRCSRIVFASRQEGRQAVRLQLLLHLRQLSGSSTFVLFL